MKHIAITENHLYSKAYAKGQKFVTRDTVVYILKDLRSEKLMKANPMKEYVNRVGLTVSKKLGGAVVRNRVKRILREGLRQTENDLNLKKGYLIVIVARTGAVEAKSDQIRRELTKAFYSLNMIENKQ
jgi:ribonuclease P protein component